MRPFQYQRAEDPAAAIRLFGAPREASASDGNIQYLAGGTTLIDLMKLDVMRPDTVVDINPLQSSFGAIQAGTDGLRLGALARMSDVADDATIRRDYPLIAQSLKLAASQQIRNMASLGGNVLQRTRCGYFRDTSYRNCNKRNPGSGCAALEGFNRRHAILGTSDQCIATYPGDFAQALVALDADVDLAGPGGKRTIRFADLHKPPADSPQIETTLKPGEMLTGFTIKGGPWRRSLYLKIRDRESYEFALASVAVALDMDGDVVREARIALGGLATIPWRAPEAEAALKGKKLDEQTLQHAAEGALFGAKTHAHNAFKVELGKRAVIRALHQAATMEA